jgi:integrase
MPIKLVPPRSGKSPNWSLRGTYLGIYVDRSAGTDRRALAAQLLRDFQGKIERGEYPEKPQAPVGPTFLSAAILYMKMRRQSRSRARYIGRLINHFGETPVADIDQEAIDTAALALYPTTGPASLNAYVYIPMSAILHHAGIKIVIRRPKGAKGRTVTDHLTLEDATAIIAAADAFNPTFALLLKILLYTGMRLGEALSLRTDHMHLEKRIVWVATSKNGKPRTVLLREDVCAELAAHAATREGWIFTWHQGGHLSHMLLRAKLGALGIPCPSRRPRGWRNPPNRLAFANFHTLRHTWATWMRRYGGVDLQGLVATGNWSDPRSAARYAHVAARDEWAKVEMLPDISKKTA